MAMIWDALMTSALAEELEALLRGKRLRGHTFRWDERELVLYFEDGALSWHLHPGRGWVVFSPGQDMGEEARPLSASVEGVTVGPDERVLEVRLLRRRGRNRALRLVVELMTNQWNALLLDGDSNHIRHLLWTRHLSGRSLSVGQRYVPPEGSSRIGADSPVTGEEWAALLKGKNPGEARGFLLDQIAYTSPINVDYLLGPTDPDSSIEVDPTVSFPRWKRLREPGNSAPCVLELTRGNQPYPIVLESLTSSAFPGFLEAIRSVSQESGERLDPGQAVEERLARALHQARGKVKGLRRELTAVGQAEEIRGKANLLLARLREVPRGADSVTLRGFNSEPVVVALDPKLNPQDNAEALYQEAARLERAGEKLPSLISTAERAVEELEALQVGLKTGEVSPEGVARKIPGKKKPAGAAGKQETRLPFRRFESSGGLEIRVGRGSRDNDALTFRYSHPEDVWLHARGRAGAHVILRWRQEGNPPHRDLSEAAILAALHSGARGSGTVPVDWTRRKYVRKPRKAPPGTVIPERVQTLFVEPDPELPARLTPKGPLKEE